MNAIQENAENGNEAYLSHIEVLWDLITKAESYSKSEKFKFNDVRNTFFGIIKNVLFNYYVGMVVPVTVDRLRPAFANGVLHDYFPNTRENEAHSNLGLVARESIIKIWHDMQKIQLVFSLWIAFEDSIEQMYYKVADEPELENRKYGNFNRIKGLLEDKLDKDTLNEIASKLRTDFVNTTDKYNYILNSLSSLGNKKLIADYRETLRFLSTLRNSVHANSKPFKDYKFKISIGEFNFVKGEYIDFFTFEVLLLCVQKLLEIFLYIRDNLTYSDDIIISAKPVPETY